VAAEPIRRVTPAERLFRRPRYAGSRAELLAEPSGPVTEVRVAMVSVDPGAVVPLHFHKRQTVEIVLSGTAVIQDRAGGEWHVGPGDTMLFASGPAAAHRWRVTGNLPVVVLVIYPTPNGEDDELTWEEAVAPPA
jgi:quercetin dioxygenase-like cupin family protein